MKNITQRFSVGILDGSAIGKITSYLSHKSRTIWCKRTAIKHACEFQTKHGKKARVVEA